MSLVAMGRVNDREPALDLIGRQPSDTSANHGRPERGAVHSLAPRRTLECWGVHLRWLLEIATVVLAMLCAESVDEKQMSKRS